MSYRPTWSLSFLLSLGVGDIVTAIAAAAVWCRSIDQLRHLATFDVTWDGSPVSTKAWCGVVEGLPVYLLEPQEPPFFWRGRFYGEVR